MKIKKIIYTDDAVKSMKEQIWQLIDNTIQYNSTWTVSAKIFVQQACLKVIKSISAISSTDHFYIKTVFCFVLRIPKISRGPLPSEAIHFPNS